jgi:hypothetical protein
VAFGTPKFGEACALHQPALMRAIVLLLILPVCACGQPAPSGFETEPEADGGSRLTVGEGGGADSGSFVGEGGFGGGGGDSGTTTGDPTTCAGAAAARSYIGCEYWPTTLTNYVWHIFDFAVVVANPQSAEASVTVMGPSGFSTQVTIAPGALTKIYLPWDTALKGPDWDVCTETPNFGASVSSPQGAYHLVSSVPVTVYQFNALEYAPQGGPAGKNWGSCPGNQTCSDSGDPNQGTSFGCFSFSNDASLLLPATAMTGNYRLMGVASTPGSGSYFAVTGTQAGTQVTVTLSATATVSAGGGIASAGPGGKVTFTLGAGDVVELAEPGNTTSEDLSGSLLQADKPVQVIAGHPCLAVPSTDPNATCDHVEQSVLPAETLGKHYIVTAPTGPKGVPVGHVVRIYGNFNGTHLTYSPTQPSGCPATIDAGTVADCGVVGSDFEITGDQAFEVGMIQQSADVVDPNATMSEGDPSLSFATPVEQYRSDYIFLAPSDYDMGFADVVAAPGTTLTLDGTPVAVPPTAIDSNFGVVRVPLAVGATSGVHVMSGSAPFGIQVIGYGQYTSYQYPGGLDLRTITPPPAQ